VNQEIVRIFLNNAEGIFRVSRQKRGLLVSGDVADAGIKAGVATQDNRGVALKVKL